MVLKRRRSSYDGPLALAAINPNASLFLGSNGSGQHLPGQMAEWAKWNRALSAAEIAALAKGKTPDWFAAGLAWYLPMRKIRLNWSAMFPPHWSARPRLPTHSISNRRRWDGPRMPRGWAMIGFHIKTRSYPELVRKRAKDATFRNLTHAAATLRMAARRSLRRRKKPSAPGQPPSSPTGRLRGSILYAVDRRRDYAVIGPSRNLIGPAGQEHEHGAAHPKGTLSETPLHGACF